MCHTMALPFTLKSILRQKKKNYGNSNISPCKDIIFKKSSKRNQNPSRYHNSITKSQVSTQAKISSFKNPHIKIDILPRGQNRLKLLYTESKHNILALVDKANKRDCIALGGHNARSTQWHVNILSHYWWYLCLTSCGQFTLLDQTFLD